MKCSLKDTLIATEWLGGGGEKWIKLESEGDLGKKCHREDGIFLLCAFLMPMRKCYQSGSLVENKGVCMTNLSTRVYWKNVKQLTESREKLKFWKEGTNQEKMGGWNWSQSHVTREAWWRRLCKCQATQRHYCACSHDTLDTIFWVGQAQANLSCVLLARGQQDPAFSTSTIEGRTSTSYQPQTEGGFDVGKPPQKYKVPPQKMFFCVYGLYTLPLEKN